MMWTGLSKKMYIFLSIILVIGLIVGIVFVISLDESTKEILFLNINDYLQSKSNIGGILEHLILLSILLVLSILLIGGPLIIFFIFYNGFSLGFIISTLTYIFGIKGMLYGIIYSLITKFIFIIILIIFSVNLFKITKLVVDSIVYKKCCKDSMYVFLKRSIIFIVLVLVNDIVLYFGGIKLLNIFSFLIN